MESLQSSSKSSIKVSRGFLVSFLQVEKKLEKSRNSSVVGDYRVEYLRHDANKTKDGEVVTVGDIIDASKVFESSGKKPDTSEAKKTQ